LIFATIEETFGVEAVKRFIQALTEKKSWSSCASNEEISSMLMDTTFSPISQQIFDSYTSTKHYPVLRLKLDDGQLYVNSEASTKDEPHAFTVSYSVLNEHGKQTTLVHNGTDSKHPAPGQTVAVDSTNVGLFRAIYDVGFIQSIQFTSNSRSTTTNA
jgi:hypothetical protein